MKHSANNDKRAGLKKGKTGFQKKGQAKKGAKTGREKGSIPLHIQKRKPPGNKGPARNDPDVCGEDWTLKPQREIPIHKRVDRYNTAMATGFGKPRDPDKTQVKSKKRKGVDDEEDKEDENADVGKESDIDENEISDAEDLEPEELEAKIEAKKEEKKKEKVKTEYVMLDDETPAEFQARVNKQIRAKLQKGDKVHKNRSHRNRAALRVAKKQKNIEVKKSKDLDKRDQEYLYGKEEIVFGDIAKAPPKLTKIKDCNKRKGENVLGKSLADYADKNIARMAGIGGMMLPKGLK